MATFGGRAVRADNSDKQTKSHFVSPQKIRDLLNETVVSEQSGLNSVQEDSNLSPSNGVGKSPCEATNKDAFFSRVGSYTCLKWTGKPRVLSPLRCAKYGWFNVNCDMLKCSTCQAFLCASIQPALDYQKYEERISEITTQLQTRHEKFCSWPDFPCPSRFWMIPISEPAVLLGAFLERFQSALILEQQLPAMKPQQLQTMSLTEDAISVLLQLIEDEQKKPRGGSLAAGSPLQTTSEPLSVQVAACIVALCGWAASPAQLALNLPILTCSYCMRKVGLWNFHQMENTPGGDEGTSSGSPPTTPRPGQEGAGDTFAPTPSPSPSPSPTPSRMKLRSQDSSRSESAEGNASPLAVRVRSRDSPSPSEEMPSPLGRGKRPMTRSRGQCEVPTSPQQKIKRPRLSSASSLEGPMNRNVFDPIAQHRDWCPWVCPTGEEEAVTPKKCSLPEGCEAEQPQPGWKAALNLFLSMKHSLTPVGASPSQGAQDKSKRVFTIFRQWQSYST